MQAQAILRSWSTALFGLFHYKIVLLSLIPLFLSLLLWGVAMWWGMQSFIDYIQAFFSANDGFTTTGKWLNLLGLIALKVVVVPLLAMWVLLPILIISSLLFTGIFIMPSIARHVGNRYFPSVAPINGSTFLSSITYSLGSIALFIALWVASLPLIFITPIYIFVQPLLWGWLTYRIMSFDALSPFANKEERIHISQEHRYSLLFIGIVCGFIGTVPSMLWLGGAMSVAYMAFFPVFVILAIWLYLFIFIFTGCWYQYYCLDMLQKNRQGVKQQGSEQEQNNRITI